MSTEITEGEIIFNAMKYLKFVTSKKKSSHNINSNRVSLVAENKSCEFYGYKHSETTFFLELWLRFIL